MNKNKTIRVTITRDELGGRGNPELNEFLAATIIIKRMRGQGIPVIGIGGIIAVERGTLTIAHEDGLDGDEWIYTFVGEPIMPEILADVMHPNGGIALARPLAPRENAKRAQLAEDDEL